MVLLYLRSFQKKLLSATQYYLASFVWGQLEATLEFKSVGPLKAIQKLLALLADQLLQLVGIADQLLQLYYLQDFLKVPFIF